MLVRTSIMEMSCWFCFIDFLFDIISYYIESYDEWVLLSNAFIAKLNHIYNAAKCAFNHCSMQTIPLL